MTSRDLDGADLDEQRWPFGRPVTSAGTLLVSLVAGVGDAIERERDRWFLFIPLLLAVGIAAFFKVPFEPEVGHVAAALASAGILFVLMRGIRVLALAAGIVLTLVAGFALAKARVLVADAPRLESGLRNVEVAGFVQLVEPRAGEVTRVTVVVTRLGDLAATRRPARARVRFAKGGEGLKPGDAIRFTATLSPPGEPVLPGDYDFARAAWFKRIGAVGFAIAAPIKDASPGPLPMALALWAPIESLRQEIGRRVTAALAGERGAIARALINGERGGISEATNTAYRDAGIFHILSISGLHMAIMAGAVFFVVRLLLALVPGIALRFPIKKWAAAAAALGALGYLLISGGEFATVRSYVTITVMFFAVLVDRPALALRNVAISALAIMLAWPESVLDVGFQMSFAAVVGLVATYEAIRERRGEGEAGRGGLLGALRWVGLLLGGIVLTTVVASIAVAPFAAFHFHKSQQYAVLANLIAVPICNFLVMPAALATLIAMPFGLEAGPLWLMGLGIDAMGWIAGLVAALPGAVGRLSAIPEAAFVLIVAGGLWLSLWRGRRRLLGLAAVAAGLALAPTLPRPDILVGRDGRLVAVRLANGKLSALEAKGGRFELTRWLEYDGDGRSPELVAQAEGFRCDESGCTTRVKGLLVAVSRHVSALAADCGRAAIVVAQIVSTATTTGCSAPRLVIERRAVTAAGSHVVTLTATGVSVATVAASRGDRPWAQRMAGAAPTTPRARRDGYRLDRFTSPVDLIERPQGPETLVRPEIEQD